VNDRGAKQCRFAGGDDERAQRVQPRGAIGPDDRPAESRILDAAARGKRMQAGQSLARRRPPHRREAIKG
jgi:hypothetical protein